MTPSRIAKIRFSSKNYSLQHLFQAYSVKVQVMGDYHRREVEKALDAEIVIRNKARDFSRSQPT